MVKNTRFLIVISALCTLAVTTTIVALASSGIKVDNMKLSIAKTKIQRNIPEQSLLLKASTEINSKHDFIEKSVNKVRSGKTDANGDLTDANGDVALDSYKKIKIDDSKIFKLYGINTINIAKDYKQLGNFEQLVSPEYSLNLPIYDSDNKIKSVIELKKIMAPEEVKKMVFGSDEEKDRLIKYATQNQGEWRTTLIGAYIPLDVAELFSNTEKVAVLVSENNLNNVEEIRYVYVGDASTEIIYIKLADGNEFGITYGKRSDLTDLENGKLYDISTIVTKLDKVINK